jgi:hypothetical protein
LFVGRETGWRWVPEENGKQRHADEVRDELPTCVKSC